MFQENEATGDRRISGSLASLAGRECHDPGAVARILLAHAVVLGFGGLPVLWMGDELGLLNDQGWADEPAHAADNRWVHRPRMPWPVPTDTDGIREGLAHLLDVRKRLPHLHAAHPTEIWDPRDPGVLLVVRRSPAGPLLAASNMTDRPASVPSDVFHWLGMAAGDLHDHLAGERPTFDGGADRAGAVRHRVDHRLTSHRGRLTTWPHRQPAHPSSSSAEASPQAPSSPSFARAGTTARWRCTPTRPTRRTSGRRCPRTSCSTRARCADALVHPEDWYAAAPRRPAHLHRRSPPSTPPATRSPRPATRRPYSSLVLATGSRARHLPLADDSGAEVHYLRQWDDAERLRAALTEGSRLGIIGGGWIGLEIASAARKHGVEVVILEMAPQPLHAVLGDEVAALFADLHRAHGVDLRTGVTLGGIRGTANGAEVDVDGDTVTVDRLLVGIGAVPDVHLAESAGITVENGVRTDARLRTSADGVYAAGDIANADHPVLGHPLRVEHWDTAIQHGKVVARQPAGQGDRARRAALLLHRPVRPRHGVRRQPRPRGLRPGRRARHDRR